MGDAGVATARSDTGAARPGRNLFETFDAAVEKHGTLAIVIFTVVLAAASIGTAIRLKLWLDEIYTLFIVNQSSVRDLLRATEAGCDGQAPLMAILVQQLHKVIGNEALALRLPSIAGFCTMGVCVFVLVRRRIGVLYGLLATLIAVCALLYYATEGRSYGLVLGCTAATLLFWQRATEGGPRGWALTGLLISGSLAVAAHYYVVFFLGALFGAELISALISRKRDLVLWIAILAPGLVLIPHLPIILAARSFFVHFWSPASAHSATSFYDAFFAQHTWVLVLAAVLYVTAVFVKDGRPDERTFPAREWIAYAVLSIAPVLVVLFVMFTVRIYVPRYTIWAVPAIAIVAVAGLHRATHGSRIAPGCGMLAFALLLVMLEAENLHSKPHLRTGETTLAELQSLPADDEPILIANHQVYLEVWYYASPELRRRMLYATDPALDLRYGWPDTGPVLLKTLRRWTSIQAPDMADFLGKSPHFFVAADGRDWLPAYLLSLHYILTPVHTGRTAGLESLSVLYDANRP